VPRATKRGWFGVLKAGNFGNCQPGLDGANLYERLDLESVPHSLPSPDGQGAIEAENQQVTTPEGVAVIAQAE
jgi:hypothetical protein